MRLVGVERAIPLLASLGLCYAMMRAAELPPPQETSPELERRWGDEERPGLGLGSTKERAAGMWSEWDEAPSIFGDQDRVYRPGRRAKRRGLEDDAENPDANSWIEMENITWRMLSAKPRARRKGFEW